MDRPKSLKDIQEVNSRMEKIYDKHINPLTEFVQELRKETGLNEQIPYFDPLDGGVNATILFILEAAGPKAVKSGFISRNNPDESAKNMFEILQEIGLERKETILWNIVPWYIGDGKKIRPANKEDISQGWIHLQKLLNMLPKVKTIVLAGRKAQKIHKKIKEKFPDLKIIECYHPAQGFINRKPGNRGIIVGQLQEINK